MPYTTKSLLSSDFIKQAYEEYLKYLSDKNLLPAGTTTTIRESSEEFENILNHLNTLDDFPLTAIFATDDDWTYADRQKERNELCLLINKVIPLELEKTSDRSSVRFKKFNKNNQELQNYLSIEEGKIVSADPRDFQADVRNLSARVLFECGTFDPTAYGDNLAINLNRWFNDADADDLKKYLGLTDYISRSYPMDSLDAALRDAKDKIADKSQPYTLRILVNNSISGKAIPGKVYKLAKEGTHFTALIANVTPGVGAADTVDLEYYDSGCPNEEKIKAMLEEAVTSKDEKTKIQAFPAGTQVTVKISTSPQQTNGYSCFDLAFYHLLQSLPPKIISTLTPPQKKWLDLIMLDDKTPSHCSAARLEYDLRIAYFTILLTDSGRSLDELETLPAKVKERFKNEPADQKAVLQILENLIRAKHNQAALNLAARDNHNDNDGEFFGTPLSQTPSPALAPSRAAPATPKPALVTPAAASTPSTVPTTSPRSATPSQAAASIATPSHIVPATPKSALATPAAAAASTPSTVPATPPRSAAPNQAASPIATPSRATAATLTETIQAAELAAVALHAKQQIESYSSESGIADDRIVTLKRLQDSLLNISTQKNPAEALLKTLNLAEKDALQKDIQYNLTQTISRNTKGSRFQKILQAIRDEVTSKVKLSPILLRSESKNIIELFNLELYPPLIKYVPASFNAKFTKWLVQFNAPTGITLDLLVELNAFLKEVSTHTKVPGWLVNNCQDLSTRLTGNITALLASAPITPADADQRWQHLALLTNQEIVKFPSSQKMIVEPLTAFLLKPEGQSSLEKHQNFLTRLTDASTAVITADQKYKRPFTLFGLGGESEIGGNAAQQILGRIRDQANMLFCRDSNILCAAEVRNIAGIAPSLFTTIQSIHPELVRTFDLNVLPKASDLLPTQYYNLIKFSKLLLQWLQDHSSILLSNSRLRDIEQQLRYLTKRVADLELQLLQNPDSTYLRSLITLQTDLHDPKVHFGFRADSKTVPTTYQPPDKEYFNKLLCLVENFAISHANKKESFAFDGVTGNESWSSPANGNQLGKEMSIIKIAYHCDEQSYELLITHFGNNEAETFSLTSLQPQPKPAIGSSPPRP